MTWILAGCALLLVAGVTWRVECRRRQEFQGFLDEQRQRALPQTLAPEPEEDARRRELVRWNTPGRLTAYRKKKQMAIDTLAVLLGQAMTGGRR